MNRSPQRKDGKAQIGNWQLAIANPSGPQISVRNRQRKIAVNAADLEKFARARGALLHKNSRKQETDGLEADCRKFSSGSFPIGGWRGCIGSFSGKRDRLTC